MSNLEAVRFRRSWLSFQRVASIFQTLRLKEHQQQYLDSFVDFVHEFRMLILQVRHVPQ